MSVRWVARSDSARASISLPLIVFSYILLNLYPGFSVCPAVTWELEHERQQLCLKFDLSSASSVLLQRFVHNCYAQMSSGSLCQNSTTCQWIMVENPECLRVCLCVSLCRSDGGAVVRASSLLGPAGPGVPERWSAGKEIAPVQHPAQSPLRERWDCKKSHTETETIKTSHQGSFLSNNANSETECLFVQFFHQSLPSSPRSTAVCRLHHRCPSQKFLTPGWWVFVLVKWVLQFVLVQSCVTLGGSERSIHPSVRLSILCPDCRALSKPLHHRVVPKM